jgi:hypothetical protein
MKWWNEMTKEDKIITGVAVASVLTLGGVLVYKKIKKNKELGQNEVIELPVENTGSGVSTPKPKTSVINRNLTLKKGSTGKEVKVLQTLMNIPVSERDGIFGKDTEAKLLALKGVKQITLNAYPNAKKPIAIGTKVMAKVDGVKLYRTEKLANGAIQNVGLSNLSFKYGSQIGVFAGKRHEGSGQILVKLADKTFAVNESEITYF